MSEPEGVTTIPYSYVSRDGMTNINAKIWMKEEWANDAFQKKDEPRGIIQIVHGMAEHIERYDHFARYLVSQGFIVCAEDHIGHGHSVSEPDLLGHMPFDGGKDILIADVHTLYCKMHADYPDLPYIVYGHSMGSLISRVYISRYGEELAACVLAGTAHGPINLSKIGESIAHLIAGVKGETYRSKFLDNMGVGAYAKAVPHARTSLDWLSTVEDVVDDYIADELSGQMFTAGAYATLLSLINEVTTKRWAQSIPNDLPILFVSGEDDPVGEMGKGVRAAAELLRQNGVIHVDEKLYEGKRHEIHNEANRDEVYEFVANWIEGAIAHE